MIKYIFDVFRISRWYRNSFMLFGAVIAVAILNISPVDKGLCVKLALIFIATCLVASGNYGINEILDAESDGYHPEKRNRPIPSKKISASLVLVISIFLYACGLSIIIRAGNYMAVFSLAALVVSAVFYNVKPFRFKDIPYLDFICEAVNNPIRLMIGWYAVATPEQIIPASFVLAYWFFGIFLMSAKRFAELRFIEDKSLAQQYRKNFKWYTEEKLTIAMVIAISAFSYMLGALARKYSVDLILFLPPMLVWLGWFFYLAYEKNSVVKDPERIFEKKLFLFYSIFLAVLFIVLVFTKKQIFKFIP